jgi:hypothetical protein
VAPSVSSASEQRSPAVDQAGRGTAPAFQSNASRGSTPDPIRSLNAFTQTEDVEPLLQKPVELSGVTVKELLGSYFFAVQGPGGAPVLVGTPEPLVDVHAGDNIDVWGGVRRVPTDVEALGLGSRLTELLQSHPIYIQARRLQKHSAP